MNLTASGLLTVNSRFKMAAACLSKLYCNHPIIVILGCTGTGKSKLAIDIAKRFNGEIINADAMQLYKGLDIITNKVTESEQKEVKHHLLGFLNNWTKLNVCEYRDLAVNAVKDIIDRKKLPIIVGGTFYYVESILYDFVIGGPESVIKSESSCSKEKKLPEDAEGDNPPQKKLKLEEYDELTAELNKLDNEKLYERLKEVDPVMAETVHPNSRRKIMRSILVYHQHGETLSSLLVKQRSQPGGCSTGGPLRFNNCIILWLRCDFDILNERLCARVDDMLSRGLVDELLEFYKTCNIEELLSPKGEKRGIYQSIGVKEFHEFLVLDEEKRETEEGRKLLEKGVELLKIATKQYAKKQYKWLANRFLKNGQRQVPPIYGLDATDISKWKENVYDVAEEVVKSLLEGKRPVSVEPVPIESTKEVIDKIYRCECGLVLFGKAQYNVHLNSKKHIRLMKRKTRLGNQREEPSIEQIVGN